MRKDSVSYGNACLRAKPIFIVLHFQYQSSPTLTVECAICLCTQNRQYPISDIPNQSSSCS